VLVICVISLLVHFIFQLITLLKGCPDILSTDTNPAAGFILPVDGTDNTYNCSKYT